MEAWNVSKVEYIDGTQEFTVALNRPFFPSKRDCRLDEKIESGMVGFTPFGTCGRAVDSFEKANEKSKKDSVRRALKAVEVIGRSNKWDWFLTLTFADNEDGCSYDRVALLVSRWTDALKKRHKDAEWLIVLEQGGKNKRWHAHALLRCKDLRVVDSGKKTSRHDAIYNIPLEWKHGFTTATRVCSSAKCGMYISKYIGKALGAIPFGKKRYWASRGLKTLQDVRITYFFDDINSYFSSLCDVADSVRKVFCESNGRWLAYVIIRGAEDVQGKCCCSG